MSSMVKRTLGGVLLGAMLVVACAKSEKKGSGSGGPATTGSAALDELINEYCAALRSCCATTGMSLAGLDDCEDSLASISQFEGVVAGTVVLREPERTQCVAEFREVARTCILPEDAACRRIYDGTRGDGESCDIPEQCKTGTDGATCAGEVSDETGSGPRTCQSLSPGQVGSGCQHNVDEDHFQIGLDRNSPIAPVGVCDIRDGLYCDTYTDPYTCQQRRAAGAACEGDIDECVEGYYCEVSNCVPQHGPGEPCEYFEQCRRDLRCIDGTCKVPSLTETDGCEGDFG
jgi:hypothetical protein